MRKVYLLYQPVNNDHCQSESCLLELSEHPMISAMMVLGNVPFLMGQQEAKTVWLLLQEFVRVVVSLLVITSPKSPLFLHLVSF